MAEYGSLQELKNAIQDSVYENNQGLVTADILRDRLFDIVDTLNVFGFEATSTNLTAGYVPYVNPDTGLLDDSIIHQEPFGENLQKIFIDGAVEIGNDLTNDNNTGSSEFFSGFAGSGYRLEHDTEAGDYNLTIDNLIVRKMMKTYELEINKVSSIGGNLVVSAANGKAYSVDGTNIYFDTDNGNNPIQFAVNDFIRAQEWTGRGTGYYLGRVTAVHQSGTLGEAYIETVTISGTPWTNMDLVQSGNSSNTARQSIIYITSSDSHNPYIDFLASVNTGSFAGKQVIRLGNLEGITDNDFGGALSGFGGYMTNMYLKGYIKITGGTGYSNISDKPSSLAGINATEGSKLSGIAAGATVGATWGTNLSNIPATLGAPSGSGLFLSSTNMGYYTGGTWKTYIDSSGNFLLGDIAGGNTGLSWNQSTGSLVIRGSITITNSIPYSSISSTPTIPTNTNQLTDGANLGGTATWSGVSGTGKPQDYANYTTNTNQLTDGAGLGTTATWGGVSGAGKPQDNATVGATWGTNLSNIPATLGAPSGSGLFLSSTYMGYYSGGTWQSYIDSSGNCRFIGVALFGTSTAVVGGISQNIAMAGPDLWENAYDGNGSGILVNRIGYNGGTSRYRDFTVYDGKGHKLFSISGSTPGIYFGNNIDPINVDLKIYGDVEASGTKVILNGAHTQATGTTDINAPGSESDMTNMSVTLTPKGNKILILFSAPIAVTSAGWETARFCINVAGSNVRVLQTQHYDGVNSVSFQHVASVTAGSSVTVKIRWNGTSTDLKQRGLTDSERILTVIDLF